MENNVTQRIREFMESTSLSILAFANSIGVPQSTLNQQLNGRNGKNIGVQISVIMATLEAYPNLSAEWLLRGEGDMKKGENWKMTEFIPVQNNELVEALKDNIALLKENNAMLKEKVRVLEAEKKAAASLPYSSLAAEGERR